MLDKILGDFIVSDVELKLDTFELICDKRIQRYCKSSDYAHKKSF